MSKDLMTMVGGTAIAGRLPFERYFRHFRNARAGMVMGPANGQAHQGIAGILFPEEPGSP